MKTMGQAVDEAIRVHEEKYPDNVVFEITVMRYSSEDVTVIIHSDRIDPKAYDIKRV